MKKVREGYKMTELGEIPEEWEVKKLKDLGVSIIGLTYSPDDLVENNEEGTLVLRSSNVQNSRIVFDDNKYVSMKIPEKLIVKENDILICSRNGSKDLIGKCALIDKNSAGNSFGAFMTIYRSEYNMYLFNVFTSYMFKRQIFNNLGATINQITTDNLNNFKVIMPPIKEQEKIASILSTVDEQIDIVDGLIEKNKELKKGLMQQLLTKGIGHTKFKKSEVGEIPEEWEVSKLENKVEIRSGNSPSDFNFTEKGQYPFFKVDDMNYTYKYLNTAKVYFDECRYTLMNKGMVVFPKRGASIFTNKVGILGQDGYFDTNTMGLNCSNELDNEYLFYQLKFIGLEKFADTTAVPQINNKHINPLKIPFPTLNEQKKISSMLSSVDIKIDNYETKKQKLEELKKGLMQQLLTGKIRTNNL